MGLRNNENAGKLPGKNGNSRGMFLPGAVRIVTMLSVPPHGDFGDWATPKQSAAELFLSPPNSSLTRHLLLPVLRAPGGQRCPGVDHRAGPLSCSDPQVRAVQHPEAR